MTAKRNRHRLVKTTTAPFAALTLVLAFGCTAKMETIEDAEAYARKRGVSLTGKTEDTKQVIAARSFNYRAGNVKVGVHQFTGADIAKKWADAMAEMGAALGTEDESSEFVKGPIGFSISEGTASERRDIAEVLR